MDVSKLSPAVRSVGVALFYGACSLSMNFLNKAVLSSYEFNFPFFIMACQTLVTILFLDVMRLNGYIEIGQYQLQEGLEFMPASVCFALHTTMSLTALHGMNIPMYGAIKRCTPIVNLVLSVVILRKARPSPALVVSVMFITVGCLIASIWDLQFDLHAYTMGIMAVFAQAGYLTLVQKGSEIQKKSTVQMLYLNGYNTILFFVFASLIVGEVAPACLMLVKADANFVGLYGLLLMSGGVLMFSTFLCTSVCSALTTSMVGVAKSVLQTIIGFFTFGGVPYHPLNITGLILNLAGGFLYTYSKHKEKQKPVVSDPRV